MVQVIADAQQFTAAIKETSNLVVIDFFATWCGPCKMIAPILDKLSDKYKDTATFFKVDVDEVPTAAQDHEVSAMPTIILFKNGEEVKRVVGANPAAIQQAIAANA